MGGVDHDVLTQTVRDAIVHRSTLKNDEVEAVRMNIGQELIDTIDQGHMIQTSLVQSLQRLRDARKRVQSKTKTLETALVNAGMKILDQQGLCLCWCCGIYRMRSILLSCR